MRTLRDLEQLDPSFVSVTYRGGRESRQRTYDLVTGMLHTTPLLPMAHLICVAHTRLELAEILVAYRKAGVENLMALGGDPPTDPADGPGELRTRWSWSSWPGPSGDSRSAWPPTRPATRPRPTWRPTGLPGRQAPAGRLRGDPVLLRRRGLRRPGGRPGRAGDRQAGPPGIMPMTTLRSIPRRATMGAAVPAWVVERPGSGRRPRRDRGGPREGIEMATELCRALLDAGRAGAALLHPQPVDRDPRDLPGPRPRPRAHRGRLRTTAGTGHGPHRPGGGGGPTGRVNPAWRGRR